jgi:ribonuclease BN (tRNA processing enzyme)
MIIRKLKEMPLSLTNDGNTSLFFLGVGSAFSKMHYQTNLLVIKGKDHLLVDCGTQTPLALHRLQVKLSDLKNYCITHTHADHIGGMEEITLMYRYVFKTKANLYMDEDLEKLAWDHTLMGGSGFNERHNGEFLGLNDLWTIKRPTPEKGFLRTVKSFDIGGINVKIFRTNHIPEQAQSWSDAVPSYGLLIDNKILFTGDTKYDPGLIEEFNSKFKLEAIFHDCQFYTGGVHAGIDEIAQIDEKIKAKTHLVHYGDNFAQNFQKVKDVGFAGLTREWHFYDF